MDKIRELTEFCNQFIADDTSEKTKVINCFTEAYRYDMVKIEKKLSMIYEFVGKNIGLSDGVNNLECLFFDYDLNCFGTLSTIEELEYLNKIIGLLIASDIIAVLVNTSDGRDNLNRLSEESFMGRLPILEYLKSVQNSLRDYVFYVDEKFLIRFSVKLQELSEREIKTILDNWYLLTATKPAVQLQYDDFNLMLNRAPYETLRLMTHLTTVIDGVDCLENLFNQGETFSSLIAKYKSNQLFLNRAYIGTLSFLYKIKNLYISTLSKENTLNKK